MTDLLESRDVVAPEALPEAAESIHPFAALGLAPELVRAVQDLGFEQPTAVQSRAIPLALPTSEVHDATQANSPQAFSDLMVSSQTGSGKTAAFLLPVLHTLLQQQARAERDAREAFQRACDEAAARGEAAPKRPKRKNPTDPRNFKPAQ